MSKVLQFIRPPVSEQHGQGESFCLQCGHTWQAVVPTGVTRFECPECRTMKGLMRFEFRPAEGQLVWECRCGNRLFYMTQDGHLCANCGIYQSY